MAKHLRLHEIGRRERSKKAGWLDTDWNISSRSWLVLFLWTVILMEQKNK